LAAAAAGVLDGGADGLATHADNNVEPMLVAKAAKAARRMSARRLKVDGGMCDIPPSGHPIAPLHGLTHWLGHVP
jgi:hypothetical protein